MIEDGSDAFSYGWPGDHTPNITHHNGYHYLRALVDQAGRGTDAKAHTLVETPAPERGRE